MASIETATANTQITDWYAGRIGQLVIDEAGGPLTEDEFQRFYDAAYAAGLPALLRGITLAAEAATAALREADWPASA